MIDPQVRRCSSLKNYTFALLLRSVFYAKLSVLLNMQEIKAAKLYARCCKSQNIYWKGRQHGWVHLCCHTHNLYQTDHSLPVSSSINPSICLFSARPSLPLTFWSSRHSSEFVHANLIRHHLYISPPLCRDAIILILDLLEKPAALALSSCASHNTLSGLLLMCSLQRATLLSSFFHAPLMTVSPSLLLCFSLQRFYCFPQRSWFHFRLRITSTSVTLEGCSISNQIISCCCDLFGNKQQPLTGIFLDFYLSLLHSSIRINCYGDNLTWLLYTVIYVMMWLLCRYDPNKVNVPFSITQDIFCGFIKTLISSFTWAN